MDRGVWRATVHGVARVRHNLVTQQQQKDKKHPHAQLLSRIRLFCDPMDYSPQGSSVHGIS